MAERGGAGPFLLNGGRPHGRAWLIGIKGGGRAAAKKISAGDGVRILLI